MSVDSPHITVSRISSCNGTRRTVEHIHPPKFGSEAFYLAQNAFKNCHNCKSFFGYTWWRVGSPSTFLSLLPLCCFPPHLGSQWGAAADLLRRRCCRDIFPHPVCTPVEASPHSTYTLFAQIKPENGCFLTKFTISADFGHHAANFTQSVQPQDFGWQNDDKNDDR